MYPPSDILEEVGRVTIAGARLDLQMGMLWTILDPGKDEVKARTDLGSRQVAAVRKLADRWLAGDLLSTVLSTADRADEVRNLRNDIVHQDWILRGPDAHGPAQGTPWALLGSDGEELRKHLEIGRREAKASPNWQRVRRDSLQVEQAQGLDELRRVEQELGQVTDTVLNLRFTVASALGTGKPSEWLKDPAGWMTWAARPPTRTAAPGPLDGPS